MSAHYSTKYLCLRGTLALLAVCPAFVSARNVVVVSEPDERPVPEATVTLFNDDKEPTDTLSTNAAGTATLPGDARFALAEHPEYASLLKQLSNADADTIRLTPATMIDELVVQASRTTDHLTHESHIITRDEMKLYPTFYQALNEIPGVLVMTTGQLYYENASSVALMINGVDTDIEELRALDKDDVLKVNTYRIAPPRLIARGFQSAIDVITKSSLTGGNASINISQAPYPLIGNNSASLFYNYKRSRFSASYRNFNQHERKLRITEHLDYTFHGTDYFKHKEGLDSHDNNDDNTLSLSYQNNLAGSYLYNVKVEGGISRDSRDLRQLVTSQSAATPFEARNGLHTSADRWKISNYFEKSFGEEGKYGTAIANVTYQHNNSKYDSHYIEYQNGPATPSVYVNSAYDIHYNAVLAELQYSLPYHDWGMLSFSLFNTYEHSKYIETGLNTRQLTDSYGATAMYYGQTGKFQFVARLGVQGRYTDASTATQSYSTVRPTPNVTIYYNPTDRLRFVALYSYSVSNPTIAQLSQTDQWLDTKLVFHGNPNLRPYETHLVALAAIYSHKYIEFSLEAGYINEPGSVCNQFVEASDYMLETVMNLDRYEELFGSLVFTVKPLGNSRWIIYNRINGGGMWGRSKNYNWDGWRFQWMPYTAVNLDKWTFSASYQFPGKVCQGQLIRPRTQSWSVSAAFRPKENLSIGLEITTPFGTGWKESERTVASSPVQEEMWIHDRDRANLVTINFDWNISFGKNQNKARPSLNQGTGSDPILRR